MGGRDYEKLIIYHFANNFETVGSTKMPIISACGIAYVHVHALDAHVGQRQETMSFYSFLNLLASAATISRCIIKRVRKCNT